jgi:prolyl-tRNA synthetase
MSERLIGAIVGVHGDNKGVILPPAVAPYQVVLVPILAKKTKTEVIDASNKLAEELRDTGLRVHFDDRDIRPGSKYYDWELRGVPLRIELGPRDLENNVVIAVRRDTGERLTVNRSEVTSEVQKLMEELANTLLKQSDKLLQDSITTVDNVYDVKESSGIIRLGWCGNTDCDDQIVKHIDMNMLGTPVGDEGYSGNCGLCGKPTETIAYYAKTY